MRNFWWRKWWWKQTNISYAKSTQRKHIKW